MMHQARQLPDAIRQLNAVVALEMQLLKAASIAKNGDLSSPEKFAEHLMKSAAMGEKRARTVAARLNTFKPPRSAETLWQRLCKFGKADTTAVQQIIANIEHDLKVLAEAIDGKSDPVPFLFHLRGEDDAVPTTVAKNAAILAKEFLYPFYDIFRDGLAWYFFGEDDTVRSYNPQHFLEEFAISNDDIFTCPLCDSADYRVRTGSHIYTTLDHFFPRSIYPHLAVHPLNLIPACGICNSSLKGSRDPLHIVTEDPAKQGDPIPPSAIVLPYRPLSGPDAGLKSRIFVEISAREKHSIDRSLPPLTLSLKPRIDHESSQASIDSLDYLVRLVPRWDEEFERLEEQAFRRVTQLLLAEPAATGNVKLLQEKMTFLFAMMQEHDIGKDPFAFVVSWLVNAMVSELEQNGEDKALYYGFNAWLAIFTRTYQDYLTKAASIRHQLPPKVTQRGSSTE